MLIPSRPMDRRTLLRGVGVSLGLPWLEGMSVITNTGFRFGCKGI